MGIAQINPNKPIHLQGYATVNAYGDDIFVITGNEPKSFNAIPSFYDPGFLPAQTSFIVGSIPIAIFLAFA